MIKKLTKRESCFPQLVPFFNSHSGIFCFQILPSHSILVGQEPIPPLLCNTSVICTSLNMVQRNKRITNDENALKQSQFFVKFVRWKQNQTHKIWNRTCLWKRCSLCSLKRVPSEFGLRPAVLVQQNCSDGWSHSLEIPHELWQRVLCARLLVIQWPASRKIPKISRDIGFTLQHFNVFVRSSFVGFGIDWFRLAQEKLTRSDVWETSAFALCQTILLVKCHSECTNKLESIQINHSSVLKPNTSVMCEISTQAQPHPWSRLINLRHQTRSWYNEQDPFLKVLGFEQSIKASDLFPVMSVLTVCQTNWQNNSVKDQNRIPKHESLDQILILLSTPRGSPMLVDELNAHKTAQTFWKRPECLRHVLYLSDSEMDATSCVDRAPLWTSNVCLWAHQPRKKNPVQNVQNDQCQRQRTKCHTCTNGSCDPGTDANLRAFSK